MISLLEIVLLACQFRLYPLQQVHYAKISEIFNPGIKPKLLQ